MRRTLRLCVKTAGRSVTLRKVFHRSQIHAKASCRFYILCRCIVVVFVVVVVAVTVVVVGMFFVVVVIFPCYRLYYLRKKINCKTFYEILHN